MAYIKPRAEYCELDGEKCVVVRGLDDFDAYRIFDCGQSFRFNAENGVIDITASRSAGE